MPQRQFQWKRETRVAGRSFVTEGKKEDISQTATVTRSEEDGLRFTVDLFNLSRDAWEAIRKDEPIEIGLGYVDGTFETVLIGLITERGSPATVGADTKYTVKGTDKSEGRLRATRFAHVWNQPTIGRIVRDIAAEADVGIRRCETPDKPFERRYQIKEKKPANRWLDRLKGEAEERDFQNRSYQWTAKRGQLYFGPKETAGRQSAVVFKQAGPNQSGNIYAGGLELSDGKTEKSDGPPSVDFEVALEPRIEKDGYVSVTGTDSRDGVYQVSEYEHESSVRDRIHKTTGTMTDVSAEFKAIGNRGSRRIPIGTGSI
jgi:hypothetical protein